MIRHFSVFALSTATALFLTLESCQQGLPSEQSTEVRPATQSSSGQPASPVFALTRSVTQTSHGTTTTFAGIAVMDSDGAHLTQVYTSSASSNSIQGPTWSPNGSSIAFVEYGADQWVWSVKAIDVSVNSSGVVTTSNFRTLYTAPHSDSSRVLSQPSWCSVGSTAKIAVTRQHMSSGGDFDSRDPCEEFLPRSPNEFCGQPFE